MNMSDSIEVQGGPISLVFSKTSRAFFSERLTGNIWEIIGEENYRLVRHLPVANITGHHETGVLGITLDPNFEKNGYIYAYFTAGKDIEHSVNEVVRFSDKGGTVKTIISGIPADRIHNGGIITFGPDGKLYIGTGVDNAVKEKSQDIKYLGGKILRINPDGSIPNDNPFDKSPVYSLGHRNIFGLAFRPESSKLYISEVGQDNDDEVNLIQAGGNYGWPTVEGYSHDSRFIDPIITYTPVITPTQSLFYKGDLYFGSYNEGSVHKLTLSEDGRRIILDNIVYQGKPFGIVGVFANLEGEFFVATTNKISSIKLNKENQAVKRNMLTWIVAIIILVLGVGAFIIINNNNITNTNNTNTQNIAPGTVNIQNLSFNPNSITINKDDTVTWQNNDSAIHNVVADDDSFDLGNMPNGGTYRHTFDKAGIYNYHCSIHPEMKGVVIVK